MVLVQLPAMVSVCTLDVGMMRIDYIYFIDEGLSPHIGCCAEIEDDEVTRDRNRRTEGGEWEPIKISLEIDLSAYIPKSPQTLHLGYVRIAMDKLSHSSTP